MTDWNGEERRRRTLTDTDCLKIGEVVKVKMREMQREGGMPTREEVEELRQLLKRRRMWLVFKRSTIIVVIGAAATAILHWFLNRPN